MYCYWSKLEVAIAVIGVAADFYNSTKRLILVSLAYFILHLIALVATALASAFLFGDYNL